MQVTCESNHIKNGGQFKNQVIMPCKNINSIINAYTILISIETDKVQNKLVTSIPR